jgi:hypothetical protein
VLGSVVNVLETRKNRCLSLWMGPEVSNVASSTISKNSHYWKKKWEKKFVCEVLGVKEVCLVLRKFAWC